jgi:hypothetical protein
MFVIERSAFRQEIVDHALVLIGEVGDRAGEREDQVE